MKKLFKLVLLVGLFLSFSATTTSAQSVTNNTDCAFRVTVSWGFACGFAGQATFNIQGSGSVQPLNIPFGARITGSKGHPINLTNCVYQIGDPSCNTGLNVSDTPLCFSNDPCSIYTANLNPGNNIVIE